jgi:hypothetical protein
MPGGRAAPPRNRRARCRSRPPPSLGSRATGQLRAPRGGSGERLVLIRGPAHALPERAVPCAHRLRRGRREHPKVGLEHLLHECPARCRDRRLGDIDTSTALTDFANGNNPRSAVTEDGQEAWVGGAAGGARYLTVGASTSTPLNDSQTNVREGPGRTRRSPSRPGIRSATRRSRSPRPPRTAPRRQRTSPRACRPTTVRRATATTRARATRRPRSRSATATSSPGTICPTCCGSTTRAAPDRR